MKNLQVRYDYDADVLYVALGVPVPAEIDEDDEGLLVRYAIDGGEVCGVTVIGFNSGWRSDIGKLSDLVSNHLHLIPVEVKNALESALH